MAAKSPVVDTLHSAADADAVVFDYQFALLFKRLESKWERGEERRGEERRGEERRGEERRGEERRGGKSLILSFAPTMD